jgi:hypothetical protein
MLFGRVSGYVVVEGDRLHLRVVLDRGNRVETVRDAFVPFRSAGEESIDLDWQADQYTQETIGNELAMAGWEALAEEAAGISPEGSGMSSAYLVRQMGGVQ